MLSFEDLVPTHEPIEDVRRGVDEGEGEGNQELDQDGELGEDESSFDDLALAAAAGGARGAALGAHNKLRAPSLPKAAALPCARAINKP